MNFFSVEKLSAKKPVPAARFSVKFYGLLLVIGDNKPNFLEKVITTIVNGNTRIIIIKKHLFLLHKTSKVQCIQNNFYVPS